MSLGSRAHTAAPVTRLPESARKLCWKFPDRSLGPPWAEQGAPEQAQEWEGGQGPQASQQVHQPYGVLGVTMAA